MTRAYCVYLRKPYNKDDSRIDPIYEIGAFGSTGCHSKNLLCKNKVQKGDVLIFIQNKRVIFITPPIIRNFKYGNHSVVLWDSSWKVKEKRPLKLQYAMKLDLAHARMINPRINNSAKISSHLRAYSKPAVDPYKFVNDFNAFVNQQKVKHGKRIFVDYFCQTFCKNDKCEKCKWLSEKQNKRSKHIRRLQSRLLPQFNHFK